MSSNGFLCLLLIFLAGEAVIYRWCGRLRVQPVTALICLCLWPILFAVLISWLDAMMER